MTKTPIFRPQWLDIISCCGKKTQLSIISAIVKYQADGTLPDFKGIKLALFRALVRDVDTQPAEHDTDNEAPAKDEAQAENTHRDNPDSDNSDKKPERPELTPEEKRRFDNLMADFLSDNRTIFKILLPYGNIPKEKYPGLIKQAIHKFPPAHCCLTSTKAFLEYVSGLTKEIARERQAF